MSLANKVENTLLARQTEAVRQMLSFNQITTVSFFLHFLKLNNLLLSFEGRWKCFICSVMESFGL